MKEKFVEGWKFLKTPYGTDIEEAKKRLSDFTAVKIPHDFMVEDANNLYKDASAFYCNTFNVDESDKRIFFIFDGMYMDSSIYINGQKAGEWKNGYTQFVLDVTGFVKPGTNEIIAELKCRYPSARWYTGGGIYRNVFIDRQKTDEFIPENGIYVSTKKQGEDYILSVSVDVSGDVHEDTDLLIEIEECDVKAIVAPCTEKADIFVKNPAEWSVDDPNLYDLTCALVRNGEVLQKETIKIGFRDIEFTPDKGLFINGEHIKLNGVCLHHDLGALGTAYNTNAMRRRLLQLKDMGVNALRLSHNVYDSDVLDQADEMGFLVVSEAFDMWEMPKTDYDYGHFFKEWHEKDLKSWVTRDRNHPCVFMWSIGNEIYDTHASGRGEELTIHLRDLVRKYDPHRNALVTSASNYMPWENAQKCAEHLDVVGYNYAENIYEKHHAEHPDWIIYGSETSSIVQSRGIYHFPLSENILSDGDLQCSSLGNSTTSWGAESLEYCICKDRDMDFSLGQFIWTGYDYIGEPTPYHTKNSYFGAIDTAGFYKDAFYVWKSAWVSAGKDPFVHVFPYWDYNEGQIIDVRVASNAAEVELFLNGKSFGRQKLTHKKGAGYHIIGDYRVPYEKGELLAVGFDENGREIARDTKRSFGEAEKLQIKKETFGNLVFAEISAVDADGNIVDNAGNYVEVEVTDGFLLGIDNGDSTDYDSYKGNRKRLFGGKLLAIVSAEEGIEPEIKATIQEADIPRNIYLKSDGGTKLTADNREVTVRALISPKNLSDKSIVFRALTKKGTDSNIAKVSADKNICKVTAFADGDFILRCEYINEKGEAKVISTLDFEVEGIGTAYLDPYGFISGSAYSSFEGKVAAGNEHGVATDRVAETLITYDNIDFGKTGSDEITIPIFALSDDPVPLEIYSGDELLLKAVYHKKSIWNVYQEDTYKLSRRLTGISSISIKVKQKIHIKGFSFTRLYSAWVETKALDADSVYGDTFNKTDEAVEGIGNNVTLEFKDIDFGEDASSEEVVKGRAPKGINTIHLRMKNESGEEVKEILEFEKCYEYEEKSFAINKKEGKWDVSFIFLPGSNFDFKSFYFKKNS